MELEEIKNNKFWAGVILFNPKTNCVLIQKRDSVAPVNPNLWAFFGGAGEKGETPANCLVREIEEELGILIDKDLHKVTNVFVGLFAVG